MAYFGEYFYTLDASNRIILPSRFREPLGSEIILFKANEGCLFIYDMPTFEQITAPLSAMTKTDAGRQMVRRFYSDASPASLDRSGRLVVPADCIEHASLKDDVVVLGAGNRIEVWDKAAYEASVGDKAALGFDAYPEISF